MIESPLIHIVKLAIAYNPTRNCSAAEGNLLRTIALWLSSDNQADTMLRSHHLEMITHDLLQWAGVPSPQSLRNRYRVGVVAHLATQRVFSRVLGTLNQAEIKFIVQKGFWLACNVYPNPVWRQYADLDLLIHDKDLAKVDSLMKSQQFAPIYSALPLAQELPDWVDGDVIDCLEYKRDVYLVDVHCNLIPHLLPHSNSVKDIWQRTRPDTLKLSPSVPCQILHPYDTLLHLMLHAAYHQMDAGLRSLLDIALAWRYFGRSFSADELWRRAEELEIEYLVAGPLYLLHYFGFFPEMPLDRLRFDSKAMTKYLTRYQSESFLRQFMQAPHTLSESAHDFLTPLLSAGKIQILKSLLKVGFPGRLRLAARYGFQAHDPRLLLYALYRPVHLAIKYLPRIRAKIRVRIRASLRARTQTQMTQNR